MMIYIKLFNIGAQALGKKLTTPPKRKLAVNWKLMIDCAK